MFKKTEDGQGDLFTNIIGQLGSRKQKLLEDPNSWHNVFYKEVYQRINESPYSVLYHNSTGRPNSSVRQIISMMILKEGHGWSDEQLFERCRFDIKVLLALGNSNFDDSIPTESTYYEFRKLLETHNKTRKEDLLKATFASITSSQVKDLEIGGKKIRMDSKLINSNIATSNRLYLIIEALRVFIKSHIVDSASLELESCLQDILEALRSKTTSNILYSLNGEKKKEILLKLGILIKCLLDQAKGSQEPSYCLLTRVYKEQYKEQNADGECDGGEESEDQDQKPLLKKPKEISTSSIQSIHDPEAAYRVKGHGKSKQKVTGYHANVTESCDPKDPVNLIVDVEVVPANISEDRFLETSIKKSESIFQKAHQTQAKQIEEVITDGGYDSIENRKQRSKEENAIWKIAKTKGSKNVYEIEKEGKDGYKVKHISTQSECKIAYSSKSEKYIIHNPNGTKRYMKKEELENYIIRQKIEANSDQESYNLRANAESTINQTFHRLKNNGKMIYRGQIKCSWYVISRALWVNMIRIKAKKVLNDLFYYILTTCALVKYLTNLNRYNSFSHIENSSKL